jgi:hypothetical protein
MLSKFIYKAVETEKMVKTMESTTNKNILA